jgi:monoamine oxidase
VDFINQNVPNGMTGAFGKLCYQDVISEYGGPPDQQSALNLIYVLGYDDSIQTGRGYQPTNAPVLAGTDEKYHVKGGNDQIISGMVSELPAGVIQLGQKLVAVKRNTDGTYTCTFQSGSTLHDVTSVNHVVLAIPFSTLRQVDLTKANLSALKMKAINNLQLGTNLKVILQFNSRVWNTLGYNGNLFGDTTAINWEITNYQPGLTGMLLNFQGGTPAVGYASKYGLTTDEGVAPAAMVSDTLKFLEPVWPGLTAAYNGLAWYNDGNIDPHLLGAYSQYNIGQYTGFSGIEPVQEGNIHFAGEQTSMNFQGFMEGAVTAGERVANSEI